MPELRAVIAAAGTGSRAGLPYPKTLHPVLGRPILVRIIELLRGIDPRPTVIVSPSGKPQIAAALAQHGCEADLVEQSAATGMGDAVLCFRAAPAHDEAEDLLLIWGDIPLLQLETVTATCKAHLDHGNDFTFPTRHVSAAYTEVTRDAEGRLLSVLETRQAGIEPRPGEREIGLFLFRKEPVLGMLEERLPGAYGRATGEHGFLYIIKHLVDRGYRVEAIPIAKEQDLISLNRLEDLEDLSDEQEPGTG